MKISFLTLVLFFISLISYSQVGIGTTNPLATLHVSGTLRIDNSTSTKNNSIHLSGLDVNGVINQVDIGSNLSLVNGVLNATGGSGGSGTFYSVTTINVATSNGYVTIQETASGINSFNLDKTVFMINPIGGGNVNIGKIKGGTDGRHIYLYGMSANTVMLQTESNVGGGNSNSIFAKGITQFTINQDGMIELVYVGALSRWIVLGFRQ